MDIIERTIRSLGINGTYKGFYYLLTAVKLTSERPAYLFALTKELYPSVGEIHGVDWRCVERALRTVVNLCWEHNRDQVNKIAARQLHYKPTVGEMIYLISAAVKADA